MRIYSNYLDKPYDVAITLDRDKKRPWRYVSNFCKAGFRTVGQLLSFLNSEDLLSSDICDAVLHNALHPEEWAYYEELDVVLRESVLRDATIIYIERMPDPLTTGYSLYILDRNGHARIIEVFIHEGFYEDPDTFEGNPVCFRVSSNLE